MATVHKISSPATASDIDSLGTLYGWADPLDLTPGWISRKKPIMGSKERSEFMPAHWRYADARLGLEAAGGLIAVELAERRNLILRNPMVDNEWATSRTLVCAYQMILPGEKAPSHRHTSNALRVLIESEGGYSIVDGAKMPMESGDVVLTPGGHFHGHGHDGDAAAYWLDCLDVPLTYLLEPMYYQPHPQHFQSVETVVTKSPFRFSRDEIAAGLDKAAADPERRVGKRLALPTPSMPTIGLTAERVDSGARFRKHRSSANRIFSVMSGSGTLTVDGEAMHWTKGDTLVVPSSHWMEQQAQEDSVLLEMSDEPLMRFANHYFVHTAD